MAKRRDRYRIKNNVSFNDKSLEGLIVMHVKGDLYRIEDVKALRALGLTAKNRDLTFKPEHRDMFLEIVPHTSAT